MSGNWTAIAAFVHPPEADIVTSVLDARGIRVRARPDGAGGATVEVPAERAFEARQVLAEVEPDAGFVDAGCPDTSDLGADLPGGVGPSTAAASDAAPLLALVAAARRLRDRRRRG